VTKKPKPCGSGILDAYAILESRPTAGPQWLKSTLLPLAEAFGIPVGDIELTEAEQKEFEIYRAHSHATRMLLAMDKSDIVKAKLTYYGWSEKTLSVFGVGSVSSTQDYLKQMEALGYSRAFLHEIDLDNPRIFAPHCLIFAVKDEHGNTVGFSARNLMWDAAVTEAKAVLAVHGKDSKEFNAMRDALPAKFVNSTQIDPKTHEMRNPIYQKSSRLLGIHTRGKHKSLYVFEGNADVVTSFDRGLPNTAGVCTNRFGQEQLDLVLGLGINHLIFVMDGDAGGKAGVDAFLKLIETECANRPGLRVELILLKDKQDPDSFIREHGLAAFLNLKPTSLFYWKMRQAIDGHEDKITVANQGVALIVNELDAIQRFTMTEQLAAVTGVPYDVLHTKVQQVVASISRHNEGELQALSERTIQQLKRSPGNILQILAGVQIEASRFAQQTKRASTQSILEVARRTVRKFEACEEEVGLKTGWPLFDKLFGGVPVDAAFITLPGKPSQGKSSFLSNVTYRTLDYNSDVIVLSHTIDDAFKAYFSRLLAVKYRYPSKWFQVAGKFLKHEEAFKAVFYEATQWFEDMVSSGRLIPLDVTMLHRSLPALEAEVRDLRIQHPSTPLFVIGDNFHLYSDGTGAPDGEAKTRNLSMAAKTLANTYDVCLMMTMELPKGALKPGERPRMINIKGTAGMAYDSSANVGVYNDLKDFREESDMVWKDKDGNLYPVIELVFDKSKLMSGFDGNIYYKFHPPSGHMEEIPEMEQAHWAARAAAGNVGSDRKSSSARRS
jgi:archaellum biogenesis ATPase FlaH